MRLPTLEGIIRRRILINFRADPDVVQSQLPARFRPKLYASHAVAGICLIRLEHIRPRMFPQVFGLTSENAAHRIAVLWGDEEGREREGVYIPRRDTSSPLNHWLGGRLFPGEHHKASFDVRETDNRIDLRMKAADGVVVDVSGKQSDKLPESSIFASVAEASAFFEGGSLGYSATKDPRRLDGIILETTNWHVEPFDVTRVYSSCFSNTDLFPTGSITFDHALLMRDIEHRWHRAPDVYMNSLLHSAQVG